MGMTAYQLVQARTTAFVCVAWAENFCAYSFRTFDRPIFECTFSNVATQKAIGLGQTAPYFAIVLPELSHHCFRQLRLRMVVVGKSCSAGRPAFLESHHILTDAGPRRS